MQAFGEDFMVKNVAPASAHIPLSPVAGHGSCSCPSDSWPCGVQESAAAQARDQLTEHTGDTRLIYQALCCVVFWFRSNKNVEWTNSIFCPMGSVQRRSFTVPECTCDQIKASSSFAINQINTVFHVQKFSLVPSRGSVVSVSFFALSRQSLVASDLQ